MVIDSARRTVAAVGLTFWLFGFGEFCPAQTQTFSARSIDFSQLDRIGDLDDWEYVLGTEWDRDFSIGGIIGKRDATIIPAIPNPFGPGNAVDAVKADTRTGARMSGHVTGGTGLRFFANHDPSGLEAGTDFQFAPSIDVPDGIRMGDFTRLSTSSGLNSGQTFTEEEVDLPSLSMGANFFFDLELESRVEWGLFPIVKYGRTNFNPDPIHVDQSLLRFDVDLDPDSNGGVGLPPTFTMLADTLLEEKVGLLDNGQFLLDKQFSVEVKDKEDPKITRRLDIGSVQVVNPFGTDGGIIGGGRNLQIETDVTSESITYSAESALFRMGLDLDGLAAFYAAGQSFTRIDEELNDNISLKGDFIDIKYGPELGYRETTTITPEFNVTLNFNRQVAVDGDNGVEFTQSYQGNWSDLPGIALLDDEPVEVDVEFHEVVGEQQKRTLFYLTDYLELTLFELEELNIYDTELSLPPILQERTSLLGNLLGEVEIELSETVERIAAFDVATDLAGSFTMMPLPSERVHLMSATDVNIASERSWRTFNDFVEPISLSGKVLTLGVSDTAVDHLGELAPVDLVDTDSPDVSLELLYQQRYRDRDRLARPPRANQIIYEDTREVITAQAIEIPAGSSYRQTGVRRWKLGAITNNGEFISDNATEIDRTNGLLRISGSGEMTFRDRVRLASPVLFHGEGHTLRFESVEGITIRDPFTIEVTSRRLGRVPVVVPGQFTTNDRPLEISDAIENAGTIVFENTDATLNLAARLTNTSTGGWHVLDGSRVTLTTPNITHDGLVEVAGGDARFDILGDIILSSTSGHAAFIARNEGILRTTGQVVLDTVGGPPSPVKFHAEAGGTIRFEGPLRAFDAGVAELIVDEGSTMVLSGVEVERPDALVTLANRGLVEVRAGANRFFYDPPITFPGEPPEIVGINVANEGTVRIAPAEGIAFAEFGMLAEIRNYAPGGAVFSRGTWELIGETPAEPFVNDQSFRPGLRIAELDIMIDRISNDETYIGTIDFGDTDGDGTSDGYSAEDYDTSLAINAANVLMSGAARFDYLNTVRENRGKFTLRNNNHFNTEGDLLNTGEIRVEANARLNVHGDLTVDEGTVLVDAQSVLDVQANTIEVIGGQVVVDRPAETLFVNTPWIVREKWLGINEQVSDIVQEGRVSFGSAHFPTIGPDGDILLDGELAFMEPLAGLEQIEGKLHLAGGSSLELGQDLANEGHLELSTGGKLTIAGRLQSDGDTKLGPDTYLSATSGVDAVAGHMVLDGVIETPAVDISAGATATGSGLVSGNFTNAGLLEVGSSVGEFEALGRFTQTASAESRFEMAGPVRGEEYDTLTARSAELAGTMTAAFVDGFLPAAGAAFRLLTTQEGIAGEFDEVNLPDLGSDLTWATFQTENALSLHVLTFASLPGDYNANGQVEQADLDLVLLHWGEDAAAVPGTWFRGSPTGTVDQNELDAVLLNWGNSLPTAAASAANQAVPEPRALVLCLVCLVALLRTIPRKIIPLA